MMKTTKGMALAMLILLLCPLKMSAQDNDRSHWYVGLQGGIPMAMSTASSFGGDKTRTGWSGGIFAGRRFNDLLGIEFQFNFGKLSTSPRACCDSRDNWLGEDGDHYYTAVLDMPTLHYDAIMNKEKVFDLGLHFNVNMLPLFLSTPSRWSVTLSPGLISHSSKATIYATADDTEFVSCQTAWNLGLACRLHVGYAISSSITAGIYTGVTYVTGDGIDGLPRYLHNANTIWDSGIRLTYNLKKGGKR